MTTEWGALAGLFPTDDVTLSWYEKQIRKRDKLEFQIGSPHPRPARTRASTCIVLTSSAVTLLRPDSDALYSKHLTLDLATLVPHVSARTRSKSPTRSTSSPRNPSPFKKRTSCRASTRARRTSKLPPTSSA